MTMQTPTGPFTIVVGIDFSDASGYALDQAVRIAQRIDRSEVHALHCYDVKDDVVKVRQTRDQLRLYLLEKIEALGGLTGRAGGIHLRGGSAGDEIVRFVTEKRADLLILGSHTGASLKSLFVGSVAEVVVKRAPCPVLIAGPKPAAETTVATSAVIEAPRPGQASSTGRARAHTYSYHGEWPFSFHDSEVTATGMGGED
jgi:universal stress protein A